jgi:hypothetical protein
MDVLLIFTFLLVLGIAALVLDGKEVNFEDEEY